MLTDRNGKELKKYLFPMRLEAETAVKTLMDMETYARRKSIIQEYEETPGSDTDLPGATSE